MCARPLPVQLLAAAAVLGLPAVAAAQSWIAPRTRPSITEVIAVDATGEPNWLYGFEDLAGDGQEFKQQEQSIDVRTAYAATDASRFWIRLYVSDPNAVGGNVSAFVFIDADRDPATGGSAAAPEIDAKLVTDPSGGGYEFVLGLRGNASISQIWEWQPPQGFVGSSPPAAQAAAEAGVDGDPIQINAQTNGYLQGSVDLALLGLTAQCDASLFLRTVNESAVGAGDLEVGEIAPCSPADADGDGVPDLVEPETGCTTDAECPFGGICVDGQCIIASPCAADADCQPDDECAPDGHCVATPGGPCGTTADCGDRVCAGGNCVACSLGGAECGAGRRCAPTGRCVVDTGGGSGGAGGTEMVAGIGLQPGDRVQGGACTCEAPSVASARARGVVALGLPLVIAALRRRRRGARARAGAGPRDLAEGEGAAGT